MERQGSANFSSKFGANILALTKGENRIKGGSKKASITSTFKSGIASLEFKSIPGFIVVNNQKRKYYDVELDIDKAFYDLLPAYKNQCKLNGKPPISLDGMNHRDAVIAMYDHIKEMVRKIDTKANVDIQCGQTYFFVAYSVVDYNDSIWAIPIGAIKHLENTNPILAKEAFNIASLLLIKMQFTHWKSDSSKMEMCFEYLKQQADELEDTQEDGFEEDGAYYVYSQEYDHHNDGEAGAYLDKLIAHKYLHQDYKKRRIPTHTDSERKLLKWIQQAEAILFDDNQKSIPAYEYDNDTDEYRDGDMTPLSDQYVLTWHENTVLFDEYMENINMDTGEYGRMYPTNFYIMRDKTTKPFKKDTWFPKFQRWLLIGLNAMYEIAKN